jgi:hypothetical protein
MGKVLPESGKTSGAGAMFRVRGPLSVVAELVEVAFCHDGCELGMHSEFPSIGSNVISE